MAMVYGCFKEGDPYIPAGAIKVSGPYSDSSHCDEGCHTPTPTPTPTPTASVPPPFSPDPALYYCITERTYTTSGCSCCNGQRLGSVTVALSGLAGEAEPLNGVWEVPVDPNNACEFNLVIAQGGNGECGKAISVRVDQYCRIIVDAYYHYGGGCYPNYAYYEWMEYIDPNTLGPGDCIGNSPWDIDSNGAPEGSTCIVTFNEATSSPCSGTPSYEYSYCELGANLPTLDECVDEYGSWVIRILDHDTGYESSEACGLVCPQA